MSISDVIIPGFEKFPENQEISGIGLNFSGYSREIQNLALDVEELRQKVVLEGFWDS